MRAGLTQQRCLSHEEREAVARCLECVGFFCRECITEHKDRVLCSACLRRVTAPSVKAPGHFGFVWPLVLWLFGVVVAWTFFYGVARILVAIPTNVHDGKIWERSAGDL